MSIPRRTLDLADHVLASGTDRRSRRFDDAVRGRALDLGIRLHYPPWLVIAIPTVAILVIGIRLAGPVGVLISVSSLVAVWIVLRRAAAGRRRRLQQERLPEIALRVARALRAGTSADRAFCATVLTVGYAPPTFLHVVQQIEGGRAVTDALEDARRKAATSAETLLLAALAAGMVQGGGLADSLDVVGAGLRDDLELGRRRRLLLSQSTLSAGVLVILPIAFAIMASALQGTVIFRGNVGLVLLVSGLSLDMIGTLWMRSLLRRLR